MFARERRRVFASWAAALILLASGAGVAASPMMHLVRRAHAAITARAEWVRWVKAGKAGIGVGEPAGWITIDSAGIDTIVLWGSTGENLQRYPCLSVRSLSFTQPNTVKVVAAHRDTHFRRLGKVGIGDKVRIALKDGRMLEYRVCDIEVVPGELAAKRVAELDGSDWLVLMTCHPFSYIGPAPDRFLVWARPEGRQPSNLEMRKPPTQRAGGRPSYFFPAPVWGRVPAPPRPLSSLSGWAAPFAIHVSRGEA